MLIVQQEEVRNADGIGPAAAAQVQRQEVVMNAAWVNLQQGVAFVEERARQQQSELQQEALVLFHMHENTKATWAQECASVHGYFEAQAQQFEQRCLQEVMAERKKITDYQSEINHEVKKINDGRLELEDENSQLRNRMLEDHSMLQHMDAQHKDDQRKEMAMATAMVNVHERARQYEELADQARKRESEMLENVSASAGTANHVYATQLRTIQDAFESRLQHIKVAENALHWKERDEAQKATNEEEQLRKSQEMVRHCEGQNESLMEQVRQVTQGNAQSLVSFTGEDASLRNELASARTTIAALKIEADTWANAAGQTQAVVHELLQEMEAEREHHEIALSQMTLKQHEECITPGVAASEGWGARRTRQVWKCPQCIKPGAYRSWDGHDGWSSCHESGNVPGGSTTYERRGRSPPTMMETVWRAEDAPTVERRKIKEADKVEVPVFPDITKLNPWKSNLRRFILVAAGNPDYTRVLRWIDDTWKDGATFQELDDPGGHQFVMLDMKLANGMVTMMQKAGDRAKRFRDKVNLRMEEASRGGGNVLKGRQMVWMLLDLFKTIDNSELVYGFDHLARLKVVNHDLHEFIIQWNHVVDNLGGGPLTATALRDVFYRKICEEEQMKYDMNLYERMREGDPSKTYKYLLYCVESVIKLQEQRKNVAEKEALLGGRAPKTVEVGVLAQSEGDGKPKQTNRDGGKPSRLGKPGDRGQSLGGSRHLGKGKGKDKTSDATSKDARTSETIWKRDKGWRKRKVTSSTRSEEATLSLLQPFHLSVWSKLFLQS